MGFSNFADICSKTPLPLCSVVKSTNHFLLSNNTIVDNFNPSNINFGILPRCYARSVELSNTIIFGIANAIINIGALGIIVVILFNIRQKYTAIGRSEYLYFFQLIALLIIFTLIVNCGVSPPGSNSYPYFVAVQVGLAGSCCWSLFINGLLGFNFWEDGTRKSMIITRVASFLGFCANFLAAILTFKKWIENHHIPSIDSTGFFVVVYIVNLVLLFLYVIAQLLISLLIVRNLWVTGSIFVGVFFFICGQVLTYRFSTEICEGVNHYLDGLFFGSICNTFTYMMVYKTWDMTTDDDLEFGVSINKQGDIVYNNIY